MKNETLDFGGALAAMKQGKNVQREGWNGKDMYLAIQVPDENSANQQPYIYIVPVGGKRVPWVASQPDLLESDWQVIDQEEKTIEA